MRDLVILESFLPLCSDARVAALSCKVNVSDAPLHLKR